MIILGKSHVKYCLASTKVSNSLPDAGAQAEQAAWIPAPVKTWRKAVTTDNDSTPEMM